MIMLKEKLLQSLATLQENSQDPESIKRLAQSIKQKVDFGDTPLDHWKTFNLIFLMYASWKDLKTNPKNKSLIKLSKECVKNMKPLFPSLNEVDNSEKTVRAKANKQASKSPRPKPKYR